MGQITDNAKVVYAPGPTGAPLQPDKAQIVGLFQLVEYLLGTAINGLVIGNAVVYATRAALFADLARPANTLGIVYNDSNPAYNGIYVKAGASGSGSWSLTSLLLPSTFAADLSAVISGLAAEVATRTVTTNEVVDARQGSASLAERLTAILEWSNEQDDGQNEYFNGRIDDANASISALQDEIDGVATNLGAVSEAAATHAGDTENPHSVTKAQVGLSATDNTADADKPVSTAQAAADAAVLSHAADGQRQINGLFDKLALKEGVWPLVEASGDILAAIDPIGRMVVSDLVRPDDTPNTMKRGVVSYIEDIEGQPVVWYDARLQRVREAGDEYDRPERVAASPMQVVTSARDTILAVGATGEIYEPAAWSAPVVYTKSVNDGGGPVLQVFVADGISERRLTASPLDCHAPKVIAPGLVRYARSDGRIGLTRMPLGATVGGAAIEGHFVYGQSLAIGSASYAPGTLPTLPHPPSSNVLMFNAGVRAGIDGNGYIDANFSSLVSAAEDLDISTQLSDTGMVGYGFALAREVGKDILVCSAGLGGQSYANLKKGTSPYTHFIFGVTRAKVLADAASRPFSLAAVQWRQGENDEDKAGPTYIGYLNELLADLTTDVKAITGQSAAPLIVMQQISRFGGAAGANDLTGPAAAQAYVGLNTAGFVLSGPQYICDFGDAFHMLPASYCFMASYAAKAVRRHLYQGRPWKPLHTKSARRFGRRIDITVAGGVIDRGGAITIDTSRVTDPGKYGVVYRDSNTGGAGAVSVASVEVTGRDTLAIHLTGVPTGTLQSVGFAKWLSGGETGQGRLTGLRCCIRDNDSEGCPVTGLPMHNYMIGHNINVGV